MKFGMYAIKDAKTGFMTPTVDQNDASALRNFEHAVNQPDSLLNSHPNDFCALQAGFLRYRFRCL